MAGFSAMLMIGGAAYAALPVSAPATAMMAENVTSPVATITIAPPPVQIPVGTGQPHKAPVIISTTAEHAAHIHHVAYVAHIAATTAPAVTTTTITQSQQPVEATTPVATRSPTPSPVVTASSPAPTTDPPPSGSVGAELLDKALTMAGVPYVYGGDSPSGFDCSGLVYWSALQLGINSMPRDTYGMLAQGVASGLLVETSTPEYGDLAFFGSGHVEFYVHSGETFGAQQPGTNVGYHTYGYGYVPSEFFRIT